MSDKDKDKDQKKQIPLRLSQNLWNDLAAWANDDFRSINGQIEYLLTECVRRRKHTGDKSGGMFKPAKPDGSNGSDGPGKSDDSYNSDGLD